MQHGTHAHLDLLPPARRLWVDSVASHTLGTLEEHVLGLKREDDLPGLANPAGVLRLPADGRRPDSWPSRSPTT